MRTGIAITSVFLLIISLAAQASTQNAQLWLKLKHKAYLKNTDVLYRVALEARFGSNDDNLFKEGKLRAALGRTFDKTVNFWIGYDFIPSLNSRSNQIEYEQRCWQHIAFNVIRQPDFHLIVGAHHEIRDDLHASGIAFRLSGKATIKLIRLIRGKVTPICSDQLYFNLNHPHWVHDKGIDQNRAFIGLAIPLKNHNSVQIGYMNQVKFRSTNTINHIVHLTYIFG